MKIGKEYTWEMGHRLPFHDGKCINLHGHSYRVLIEVEGEPDDHGLLIDFYELDHIMKPLIEELDHSFMVNASDKEMIEALNKLGVKQLKVDFHTTVENIGLFILGKLKEAGMPDNVEAVSARVYETIDAYAESRLRFR